MNAKRRRKISKVIGSLEDLNCTVEDLQEEEETAFDSMPESLQYSERGEDMQENADALSDASGSILEAIDFLTDILNKAN